MLDNFDELLKIKPYSLHTKEKNELFLKYMKQSFEFHYNNCLDYKIFCDKKGISPSKVSNISKLPYLPVSIFKKISLLSVPSHKIIKIIKSSATTNNLPSLIHLDQTTTMRQMTSLNSIMKDFLGNDKLDFIILDSENTLKDTDSNLSSRGSAIRGMLILAKKFYCILNNNLEVELPLVSKIMTHDNTQKCIFGFTWLIYKTILENQNNEKLRNMFSNFKNSYILHIGGWKKLTDISIEKKQFNDEVSLFFNTTPNRVIDLYGMTEQLGIVYPDCEFGYKHVPIFSEILIRDLTTFDVLPDRQTGFIQVISPIPNSYPGISLLTDDLGQIIGRDDCQCGRKGVYFVFKKRSEIAEPKGCGDTLDI